MKPPVFFLIVCLAAGDLYAGTVSHDLKVRIDPVNSGLAVEDSITLPEHKDKAVFSLHRGLAPSILTNGTDLAEISKGSGGDGISAEYSVTLPKGVRTFKIKYGGRINHPPADIAENYARGFSETPGLITPDGCYLTGAAFWYPKFGTALSSFKLKTDLPEGYDSVAGGDRTEHTVKDGRAITVWNASSPQDEITLACGKYTEYKASDKKPDFYVFLREPDDALAQKYLAATRRYIEMYSGLIGPYPYGKFALVENFWETGYGLPSFTLLGPKVVRFPFILNSSYPHEILHNWWGNGVFVDYEKGNWCEGLTAYLADYLTAEGHGKGKDYRMTALQKYSDYVRGGKDFPLREFRSRHSSASEAIGYGKALMFYHMLRTSLGDEKFKAGLRDFYRNNKFKYASFEDLKRSFEKQTGRTRLDNFFAQWVDRPGAPELALKNVRVTNELGESGIEFSIVQLQTGPAYKLEVPVAIYLDGISRPRLKRLLVSKKEELFKYSAPVRPARVELDPEFDIFRKLSPLETPPTLSRLLGADKPLIILPAGASSGTYGAYEAFARAWNNDKANLPDIRKDSEFNALPKDRQIWLLGRENTFYPAFAARLAGAGFSTGRVMLDNQEFPLSYDTFVFADNNPGDPAYSTGLIITGTPEKLQPLAAKLPHYGKYGYLVFDSEMTSIKTGGWEPGDSPLSVKLEPSSVTPVYPAREPLAAPESLFSAERMKSHISYLASDLEGRGPGEPGLEQAGRYIYQMFRGYGLKPFFDGKLTQGWNENGLTLRNLAGVVEGSDRKEEYVVVSAHYDHLPSEKGKIYPGANDNASGTSLMLELAEYYAKQRPERNIIFAAFSGEEEGRLGSKYFIKNLSREMLSKMNADVNLDSVGRLEGGKMLFLNSGSSDKWGHILRGAGFVTGTDYEASRQNLDASDQESFIEAGIPAIQVLSGINADYHKPTDTTDKIDYPGMVKEAEFLKEIIDYLAGDSGRLTPPPVQAIGAPSSQNPSSTGIQAPGAGSQTGQGIPSGERKSATGLVPSFEWQGKGVKADSVIPGSPLSKTGFRAGDVIIKINDIPTDDLRTYSRELKKYKPGEKIKLTYLSDNQEKDLKIELVEK